jgi:hypothetical protein
MLQPGAVRAHIKKGNSQSHPGVSPLNPLTHRNTGFQPLPKPLGLPPYHYALADHFPAIAKQINSSGKMILDVLGDSGGVQDGQFQSDVADAMVAALVKAGKNAPLFCYHVGDVVYFTGLHDDYYGQFYGPYEQYTRPSSPSPAITTARSTIPPCKPPSTAGSTTSCKPIPTSIPSQKTPLA